jgi:oligoribonuclease NrnB/cAMP/cGMP phosphodiesterase (DHH superfamily)
MKTDHIHTPKDGRGLRDVIVNGKLVDHVFFADTRRGIVRAYKYPLRLDKWRKRVLFETLHGVVEVRAKVGAGETAPEGHNLPYTMSSDAGHEMAKGKPFAACYWDTPKGRVFSLRSTDEGADVSEVAKQYGGGGHRNASGFTVSFAHAQAFEV